MAKETLQSQAPSEVQAMVQPPAIRTREDITSRLFTSREEAYAFRDWLNDNHTGVWLRIVGERLRVVATRDGYRVKVTRIGR